MYPILGPDPNRFGAGSLTTKTKENSVEQLSG